MSSGLIRFAVASFIASAAAAASCGSLAQENPATPPAAQAPAAPSSAPAAPPAAKPVESPLPTAQLLGISHGKILCLSCSSTLFTVPCSAASHIVAKRRVRYLERAAPLGGTRRLRAGLGRRIKARSG